MAELVEDISLAYELAVLEEPYHRIVANVGLLAMNASHEEAVQRERVVSYFLRTANEASSVALAKHSQPQPDTVGPPYLPGNPYEGYLRALRELPSKGGHYEGSAHAYIDTMVQGVVANDISHLRSTFEAVGIRDPIAQEAVVAGIGKYTGVAYRDRSGADQVLPLRLAYSLSNTIAGVVAKSFRLNKVDPGIPYIENTPLEFQQEVIRQVYIEWAEYITCAYSAGYDLLSRIDRVILRPLDFASVTELKSVLANRDRAERTYIPDYEVVRMFTLNKGIFAQTYAQALAARRPTDVGQKRPLHEELRTMVRRIRGAAEFIDVRDVGAVLALESEKHVAFILDTIQKQLAHEELPLCAADGRTLIRGETLRRRLNGVTPKGFIGTMSNTRLVYLPVDDQQFLKRFRVQTRGVVGQRRICCRVAIVADMHSAGRLVGNSITEVAFNVLERPDTTVSQLTAQVSVDASGKVTAAELISLSALIADAVKEHNLKNPLQGGLPGTGKS